MKHHEDIKEQDRHAEEQRKMKNGAAKRHYTELAEQVEREQAALKQVVAERKAKDKAHRAEVEADALEDITDAMRTPQCMLDAIKEGIIRHVRIIY